jgi:CCR4-NOT transcription complex subunit 2
MGVSTNFRSEGTSSQGENLVHRSQVADSSSQTSHNDQEEVGPEVHDPLSHMSEMDRWGLKGWSFMMNNFPDYSALVNGSNITNLGFDLNSSE